LYWNLRRLYFHIQNNAGTLNYGMCYRKGYRSAAALPSPRCTWWSAIVWRRSLAQVRVAVLNEEFSVKKLAVLTKTSTSANSTSARRAA
jgi:hypothetical protein